MEHAGECWFDAVFTPYDEANYNTIDGVPVLVNVAKGKGSVETAPKALSPTYNGKAQSLVAAGAAKGGTMLYSLDGADFTEELPAVYTAGNYKVWYMVEGDEDHEDSEPAKISVTMSKADISGVKVTLEKESYTYDGKEKRPAVKSVVLNDKKLKVGIDYTVKYENSKKLGTATAVVTGKDNYKGSAKATYKIALAKAKISTAANADKKTVKASWKKVPGTKEYQLQYKQVGGKWKTVTVKGTSKTVKGLAAGKLYQFRVRAVAGKQEGAWSNASNRYLRSVKGVSATAKKAGSVTATWKADPKADAGYTVVVRYKKGGVVAAKASVGSGKTKATVKGLKAGKKLWVEVCPLRSSGGQTYEGVFQGAWAKDKSGKSVKARSVGTQQTQGSGLTAARV